MVTGYRDRLGMGKGLHVTRCCSWHSAGGSKEVAAAEGSPSAAADVATQ